MTEPVNSPIETSPTLEQSIPPAELPVKKASSKALIPGILIGVLVLVLSSGFLYLKLNAPDIVDDEETVQLQTPELRSAFEYIPENTVVTPQAKTAATQIAQLENFTLFDQANPFSDAQKSRLDVSQFVIVKNNDQFFELDPTTPVGRTDDWGRLYGKIGGGAIWDRAQDNAVFVTTDYVAHVFHRLLEKELEYLEKNFLYKTVSELTASLYEKSVDGYNQSTDPLEKASFGRLTAFFAVPKVMLETAIVDLEFEGTDPASDKIETMLINLRKIESEMSASAFQAAGRELNLIIEAKEVVPSPLFGAAQESIGLQLSEDYTQYQPRSHYNKNSLLRTYFRVMMWYGRANFMVKSPELTRDAMHMVQFFTDEQVADNWRKIYNPITFLVGESDDLTWLDYLSAVDLPKLALSTAQVTSAQSKLEALRAPEVMGSVVTGTRVTKMSKEELQSSTKGFRLFGQRTVADAVIFTKLTQGQELPDEKTGQSLPSNTTSLFVAATLGLPAAEPLATQWIEQEAPLSAAVLADRRDQLKTQFESLDESAWTKNIYWSWLYTINALGMSKQELATGYPLFMQNDFWLQKNLQTALGTWTELKHDTLLYAKQSYAEMGAGGDGDIPAVPHGYVEPNIKFFDRLIALQKMKMKGLSAYSLTDGVFEWRNQELLSNLEFFRTIAVKELQNEPITDDEFEQLRLAPGAMSSLMAVLPGEEQLEAAARSALIADVHTDTVRGKILYQATGIPDFIYVAINDIYGPRLTKGLVYRHYEFEQPLSKRQTDEQWQAKVYQGTEAVPNLATWANSLRP